MTIFSSTFIFLLVVGFAFGDRFSLTYRDGSKPAISGDLSELDRILDSPEFDRIFDDQIMARLKEVNEQIKLQYPTFRDLSNKLRENKLTDAERAEFNALHREIMQKYYNSILTDAFNRAGIDFVVQFD